MSTYVMADLHGQYQAYLAMLEKINFQDQDMLYILGDVLDRGPDPIKIILDLMERYNVEVITGNHCVMACDCFSFLMKEITSNNLSMMNDSMIERLLQWLYNGGDSTLILHIELNKMWAIRILAANFCRKYIKRYGRS